MGKPAKKREQLTVDEVVDALGGKAATGRLCVGPDGVGISGQAVSAWGDAIPELQAYRLAFNPDCPFEFDQLPVRAS